MSQCGADMVAPQAPAQQYAKALLAGYTAHLPFACGYALGVEVEAGYEIAVLYKGLSYRHRGPLSRTRWFDAHLAEGQEDEHAKASLELVERVAETEAEVAQVREGFTTYCNDVSRFMSDLNRMLIDRVPTQVAAE